MTERGQENLSNNGVAADASRHPCITGIVRNDLGQLVAHLEGVSEPVTDVHLARCFPWTLPDAHISVRNAEGHEVVLLGTLDDLDPGSREVAEEELRDKIFDPKILRILDHTHEFGISSIKAETDRGTVIFQIRGRDDIRHLSATRALFRDADGNTYELPDLNQLDPNSRRRIQEYF